MCRDIAGLVRLVASSVLLAGSFAFAPTPAAGAAASSIAWRGDYARALAEARSRNRAVWIQFTGPWCPWCERMQRDTFPDPRIVGLARDALVPVLLRSDTHEDVALRYGLAGLPATILVSPQGEVLAKHEGYLDPSAFQAYVVSTLDRSGLYRPRGEPPAPVAAAAAPLALGGHCPVSLVTVHRLVAGRAAFSAEHDGRVYRFASADLRDRFRKQPEVYVPVNAGRCPVRQVDEGTTRFGDPRYGVLYEGHLYLCADEPSRALFLKQPERYAHVDVADRGFCPHCWARDTLLVRGRPEHSLTRSGQRFFFPDDVHLQAFRASAAAVRR